MNYSNLGLLEIAIKHTQDLRRSLSGKPSAATLAAWRLGDTKYIMFQDYDVRQDNTDIRKNMKKTLDLALDDIFKDWK